MKLVNRRFRANILNAASMRAALDENRSEAKAEFLVAVFGVPDTYAAAGNAFRQVIDKGAFRTWIEANNFRAEPLDHFVDHGGAAVTGVVSDRLKIGKDVGFEETDEGLVVESVYNLEVQEGRDAFSRLQFNPVRAQFSFSNTPDEVVYRGKDGFEHVKEFKKILETSQVAFGAQELTGLMAARALGDMRTVSLDALPDELRDAWFRSHPGDYSTFVVSAFAADDSRSSGFVIVFHEAGFWQVPWSMDSEGAVVFSEDERRETEQAWVVKGTKKIIDRALTLPDEELVAALTATPELAKRVQALATEAMQPFRDVADFYRSLVASD